MSKNEKMTYAKALAAVLAGDEITKEIREKLENLLAQQTKRATAERKPTKNQRENEVLRSAILDFLSANAESHFFCEQIAEKVESCNGFSTSKISALMKPLVDSGAVVKETDNKKVCYRIA